MKIYMASKKYIKWMESKRPIDVEAYIPLSIIMDPKEEYAPKYIVPHVLGVKPYIPEEVIIDVEEWEAQTKEWEEYQKAEAILASKKPKIG